MRLTPEEREAIARAEERRRAPRPDIPFPAFPPGYDAEPERRDQSITLVVDDSEQAIAVWLADFTERARYRPVKTDTGTVTLQPARQRGRGHWTMDVDFSSTSGDHWLNHAVGLDLLPKRPGRTEVQVTYVGDPPAVADLVASLVAAVRERWPDTSREGAPAPEPGNQALVVPPPIAPKQRRLPMEDRDNWEYKVEKVAEYEELRGRGYSLEAAAQRVKDAYRVPIPRTTLDGWRARVRTWRAKQASLTG